MTDQSVLSPVASVLLMFAAFIVCVAGIQAAAPILIPFLLAVFIAIVLAPVIAYLQRWRIPPVFSLFFVLLLLVLLGLTLAALVGNAFDEFTRNMPLYKGRMREGLEHLLGWLAGHGVVVSRQLALDYLDPSQAMNLVARLLGGLGGVLTNGLLILLTVAFILAEASGLPGKLVRAFGDSGASMGHARAVADNINRYMVYKTIFSLLTGGMIALLLWMLGVDFWPLWGVLAFLLNFIPNIGSIIAAIPAVLLALVQLGMGPALLTALVYIVVNIVIGSFLEPRFMGRGLGLSTLVVFLSLIFWGWVLGPVGMLLSVPLTITAKIILDGNRDTRWMAVLLGNGG